MASTLLTSQAPAAGVLQLLNELVLTVCVAHPHTPSDMQASTMHAQAPRPCARLMSSRPVQRLRPSIAAPSAGSGHASTSDARKAITGDIRRAGWPCLLTCGMEAAWPAEPSLVLQTLRTWWW